MIGRIHIKRMVKRAAGRLSAASLSFSKKEPLAQACILVYHRVANIGFIDSRRDDWNVPPRTFERQIQTLADIGTIVPLPEIPMLLRSEQPPRRPWICLTFDDGFANFYEHALPVLEKYQAPVTFFVPTDVIGSGDPMPFDRWACDNRQRVSDDAWRPINWQQLEECVASDIVTLGSHSRQHLNGSQCAADCFADEAASSREALAKRFGNDKVQAYAYPYGSRRLGQVPERYVQAVADAGYSLAVTTDLGLATADSDLLTLPRVEAHQVDGPSVMRAKASGSIGPYSFTDRMRKSHRT